MNEKTIAMGLVAMVIVVLAGLVGWFLYESEKQRRLALYWRGEYDRCVREYLELLKPRGPMGSTGPIMPEPMAWYGRGEAHK